MSNNDDEEEDIKRDFAKAMLKSGLVSAGGPNSNLFVSPGIQDQVSIGADGIMELTLDDDDDDEAERQSIVRGFCARSSCSRSADSRCTRCWRVDYCSRECQKADWKRHKKSECTPKKKETKAANFKGPKAAPEVESWQALSFTGKQFMAKGKYQKAIPVLLQAIEKGERLAGELLIDVSKCYMYIGEKEEALRCAYTACEVDGGNPKALVQKALVHEDQGDAEAAWLAIYSCYNSHVLKRFIDVTGTNRLEDEIVFPLYKRCLQSVMKLVGSQNPGKMSPSGFILPGYRLAGVPFTIEYAARGQCQILQDRDGEGWHTCRPHTSTVFPELQHHSVVKTTDGKNAVIFGGSHGGGSVNTVMLFSLNGSSEAATYNLTVKECSGDIPPPVEGHSACVVGKTMFAFGGSCYIDGRGNMPSLNGVYSLDLETWVWTFVPTSTPGNAEDTPDNAVCFGSLTKLDEDRIVLIGGRQLNVPGGAASNGMVVSDQACKDPKKYCSTNMHTYSVSTQTWSRLEQTGFDRTYWGHGAHNIDDGRVLLLGGQDGLQSEGKVMENSVHILEKRNGGGVQFTPIEPRLTGIPPPLSLFRSSTWLPSQEKLLLFGGRSLDCKLSASVLEMSNDANDIDECMFRYDSELFCFDVPASQWTRLRTPEFGKGRCGHTLVELNGKILLLGGSVIPAGDRGQRDERDYVENVLQFDLTFPVTEQQQTAARGSKSIGKRKGKRKGRKQK